MDGLAAIVADLITEIAAWDVLADLGSDARTHVEEQVAPARQLVNDGLSAIGDAGPGR